MFVAVLSILPAVFPDGLLIAYSAKPLWGAHGVFVLDPATGRTRKLSTARAVKNPVWIDRNTLQWAEVSGRYLLSRQTKPPFRQGKTWQRRLLSEVPRGRRLLIRFDETYIEGGEYRIPADGGSLWKGTRGYWVVGSDKKLEVYTPHEGIERMTQAQVLDGIPSDDRPSELGVDGLGRTWVGTSCGLGATAQINLFWWLDERRRQAHVLPTSLAAHDFDGDQGVLAGTSERTLLYDPYPGPKPPLRTGPRSEFAGNRLEVWDLETATRVATLEGIVHYAGVSIRPAR